MKKANMRLKSTNWWQEQKLKDMQNRKIDTTISFLHTANLSVAISKWMFKTNQE